MNYYFKSEVTKGFFKSLGIFSKVWIFTKKLNHFLKSIEVILVIVALGFAYTAYLDSKEQIGISKTELKSNSVNNAWAILAAKVPGNSGKVSALELLAKEGEDLYGIDMSEVRAESVSDSIEEIKSLSGEIINPRSVYLVGLNLSFDNVGYSTKLAGANFEGANLLEANFSGSDLIFANFTKTDLEGADFSGAHISGASFKGIKYSGNIDFTDCYIFAKDLNDTKLFPRFDERFIVRFKENKSYRVTTLDEKKLISHQIADLDHKIKTNKNQHNLENLQKQREKLLSEKWLREDLNGHAYKIEIVPQILY